jgi:ferrous iron transporter FeoB
MNDCHSSGPSEVLLLEPVDGKKIPIIALAGQPNMGKSTLFNLLTGLNQHVGNWPGKTVEQRSGTFTLDSKTYHLVDLPGTYSLTANSPEEVIAREFILTEKPDVVIAVVSAANLERSLYLVSELVCLPAPVVVALNMMDVAKQEGMTVDTVALSKALNLPVIPITATKALGVRELLQMVDKVMEDHHLSAEPNIPEIRVDVSQAIDEVEALIGDYVPMNYRFELRGWHHGHNPVHHRSRTYAFFGIPHEPIANGGNFGHQVHEHHFQIESEAGRAGGFEAGADFRGDIAHLHHRYRHEMRSLAREQRIQGRSIHDRHANFVRFDPERSTETRFSHSFQLHQPPGYPSRWVALKLLEGDTEITKMMKALLPDEIWQKVHAILLKHDDAMVAVASGRYNWISEIVQKTVEKPKMGQISITERLDRVATHPVWGLFVLAGILGLVFWLTFTIGSPAQAWLDTQFVSRLGNLVSAAMVSSPAWLRSLFVNGIIGGVGSVITFLPILIIFFASFGFLEDVGYMARAAYVMDNIMHMMGLHGKSFLPLFLGFGCNVPAIMGTRVIDSKPARILTILIAPLVPCTARMAVIAFLAPTFFGKQAFLVSWGLILFSIFLLVVLGVLLNKIIFKGERSAFIMEMPLYHIPNIRTVGLLVWQRSGSFLKKAGTTILVASVIIWGLSYLPYGNLNTSYLAIFGKWLSPVGKLMGFDWRLTVALISSFPAKENAIATLGVLFGTSANSGLAAILGSSFSGASAISFLVVTMLFIPCLATVAIIKQETNSFRWTAFSVLMFLVLSTSMGMIVYHIALLV